MINLDSVMNGVIDRLSTTTGIATADFKYLGSDIEHGSTPKGVVIPNSIGTENKFDTGSFTIDMAFYSESYDGLYSQVSTFVNQLFDAFDSRDRGGCVTFGGNTFNVIFRQPFNLSNPETYVQQGSQSEARHFKVKVTAVFDVRVLDR
ncbi:virion structural protein [Acaryochloris phage A-HIS1]|nr:virion structural protein [Acaryochloris phage A-HIS1]